MRTSTVIRGTAYVVSFIWSIIVALSGLHLSSPGSKVVSFIPLLMVLLFAAWDKYLWRLPPFVFIAGRPDLNGTWLGQLDAQWLDSSRALKESSEAATLVVRQTFTTLSVTLVTAGSKSYSVLSDVRRISSGEYCLSYQYSNTPIVKFREQLVAHDGSVDMKASGPRPSKLAGEYWTNRLSRGSVDFAWISKRRADDLAEAQGYTPTSRSRGK